MQRHEVVQFEQVENGAQSFVCYRAGRCLPANFAKVIRIGVFMEVLTDVEESPKLAEKFSNVLPCLTERLVNRPIFRLPSSRRRKRHEPNFRQVPFRQRIIFGHHNWKWRRNGSFNVMMHVPFVISLPLADELPIVRLSGKLEPIVNRNPSTLLLLIWKSYPFVVIR